jgi:SET domain-containing protein
MEHTEEGIYAGPSRHGMGVFAARPFFKDDYVGPIPGEIIPDPDHGSEYAIDLGDQTLEPAAPFRFLNHSCQPNCALVVNEAEKDEDGTPRDPSVWLEVLCEVAPGEAMTIDYAWHADVAIRCDCGAAACRGWIVAEEGLEQIPGNRTK